ncbi:MAG: twin-arginine translocase TatA/TatE family subunit [Desulfobacterium sp.]|nr:twin-arginine translocase TatA/TatE family subunit [Desulfobacterium sp.]
MFGLGMPEVLLLMAIALMVIGPKKLPELAKTLGRAMGEFKKAAQDFKRSIDMEDAVKKFEEPTKSVRETISEITDPLGTKKSAAPPKDSQPDQKIPSEKDQLATDLSARDQDKNKDRNEDEKTSHHEESTRDGAGK